MVSTFSHPFFLFPERELPHQRLTSRCNLAGKKRKRGRARPAGNPEWEDKKSIAFCSGTEKMFLLFATRKQEGLAYPVGSDGGIRHPTTEMAVNSAEYIPFLPSFLFLIPISHSLHRCPSTGSDRELSKARASGTWG